MLRLLSIFPLTVMMVSDARSRTVSSWWLSAFWLVLVVAGVVRGRMAGDADQHCVQPLCPFGDRSVLVGIFKDEETTIDGDAWYRGCHIPCRAYASFRG